MASEHDPPRTDVVAPVSVVITPSATSGMPASRSTFRRSSGIPRIVANVLMLAALVNGRRGENADVVPIRFSGL